MLSPPLVLVVDDEAPIRALLQLLVKRIRPDATVYVAENGHEALALYHQVTPDVLITDVNMPIMSGIELIRALRATGIRSRSIIVSGDLSQENDALLAGADYFVYKPDLFTRLPPLLQQLLPPAP